MCDGHVCYSMIRLLVMLDCVLAYNCGLVF